MILFILMQKSKTSNIANLAGNNINNTAKVIFKNDIVKKITLCIGITFMLNSLMIAKITYQNTPTLNRVIDDERIDLNQK